MTDTKHTETLAGSAIGFLPVAFQAVAVIGPLSGLVFSLAFVTTYAGGATPLSILLVMIGVLFVAVSMAELGKHLSSAGGIYTYVARGLGERLGFIVSWIIWLAYLVNPAVLFLLLGSFGASALHNQLGVANWVWWPIIVLAIAAAWVLVVRGVRLSTRVTLVLGLIEVLVLVAISVTLIASAGDRNTLSVFAPHTGNVHGIGSVFGGMVYALLAFVGFDTAASLSEEAKKPRKTVPLAMVTSVVFVGLLFVLASYAVMVYWGPNKVAIGHDLFANFNSGDPIDGLAKDVWGWGWVIVLLACVNSIFNAGVGSTNAQARMGYAVARIGMLHRNMARVHQRHRTPARAASFGVIFSLAVCLVLSFAMGGVAQALGFVGALATLLFVIAYGSVALSCLGYYWRVRRSEFRFIRHGVVPILGFLFLVPVLLAALGVDFLNLGIAPLDGDAKWTPELVGIWLLGGAVTYVVLRVRRSAVLEQLDMVSSEEVHATEIADSVPAEVGSAA